MIIHFIKSNTKNIKKALTTRLILHTPFDLTQKKNYP